MTGKEILSIKRHVNSIRRKLSDICWPETWEEQIAYCRLVSELRDIYNAIRYDGTPGLSDLRAELHELCEMLAAEQAGCR